MPGMTTAHAWFMLLVVEPVFRPCLGVREPGMLLRTVVAMRDVA